ncbi:MAG: cupin domain-containing protein [Acidimicrobiia bacterium]
MTDITVVALDDVEPVLLGGGSWSRVLVSAATTPTTGTTLGYTVFAPATATIHMRHEAEELAYVVSGSGVIQLDEAAVRVESDGACHIPRDVWHSVVNDSPDTPLVMVFVFASPEYPPTERRSFVPTGVSE